MPAPEIGDRQERKLLHKSSIQHHLMGNVLEDRALWSVIFIHHNITFPIQSLFRFPLKQELIVMLPPLIGKVFSLVQLVQLSWIPLR